MSKGIFIVGTDTDVGKTFVAGQIVKALTQKGVKAGYYKAVLSGGIGDAKEVIEAGGLSQSYDSCVSYVLENPVSPHLAAKIEKVHIDLIKIKEDYEKIKNTHEFVCVEGSGGIVCPIQETPEGILLLEDIIKLCELEVILVTRSGVGTINHTALTVSYLKSKDIPIKGIIMNQYDANNFVHQDNKRMIETLTKVRVIGVVTTGGSKDGVWIHGL